VGEVDVLAELSEDELLILLGEELDREGR
jgi:hypothetical protein